MYLRTFRPYPIGHQVPACITLAQALLESGAGQSELAVKANNHFGIKCTSDWKGRSYNHSDDRENECFRRYNSVRDSYEDHSQFLLRPRYESLFQLDINNYKGWCHGLRACGYATDPKYPSKLIGIIELYELHKISGKKSRPERLTITLENQGNQRLLTYIQHCEERKIQVKSLALFHDHISARNNGVRYIIAGPNDTYASLAKLLNMYERTLRRYNDAQLIPELHEGDIVYIYPKRFRASARFRYHVLQEGDTPWSISQQYGIQLKSLYKINNLPMGASFNKQKRIRLR